MSFVKWLVKTAIDFFKELWQINIFRYTLLGLIVGFGYIYLLFALNGYETIMKFPWYELSYLVFPLIFIVIFLPILYDYYKKNIIIR